MYQLWRNKRRMRGELVHLIGLLCFRANTSSYCFQEKPSVTRSTPSEFKNVKVLLKTNEGHCNHNIIIYNCNNYYIMHL